jgi:hypothetical protein
MEPTSPVQKLHGRKLENIRKMKNAAGNGSIPGGIFIYVPVCANS